MACNEDTEYLRVALCFFVLRVFQSVGSRETKSAWERNKKNASECVN